MRPRGSRVQVAQHLQFLDRRRVRLRHRIREPHSQLGVLADLLARDSRVQAGHHHLVRFRVRPHDAQVRHQQRRALRADAQFAPLPPGPAVAQRGQEIQLLHETARALPHHDEDLPAAGGDLGGAAAARQPHLGRRVIADHRAVQVAEAVHLRAAQKPDGDASALQPVAEHLRHGDRGQRRLAQFAVADRERQHVRPRAAACPIRRSG